MVVLRYDDPGLPDRVRFSRFNTAEEALAQAAHDQARDGRDLGARLFERDGVTELAFSGAELAAATRRERQRLERLAAEGDSFDPNRLLAGLTPSQIDRLQAALTEQA